MMWDLRGNDCPPPGVPIPFPIPMQQAPHGGPGPSGFLIPYPPSMQLPMGMPFAPPMPSSYLPRASAPQQSHGYTQTPYSAYYPTHDSQHTKQHSSHAHYSHGRPRALSHSQVTRALPSPHSAHFQYSKCTGRKKALCIGINYKGQRNELRGCINDAKSVRDFLIRRHGYKERDIVILTDDTHDYRQQPTRKNIIDSMHWLVRSAKPHDSLFFHYSGHGGQTPDLDGDEVDGFDEVIFPSDFKKRGHIIDDEMHDIMVKPLPPGCRLTALFDSCHSGTVLDLPYIYSAHGRLKGNHVTDRARKRKEAFADVISWSGCEDGQTSADTFAGGVAVGAMSHAFIASLTKNPNQSYEGLLKSVRKILEPNYSQKPQLGSSHHIDTSLRFIL